MTIDRTSHPRLWQAFKIITAVAGDWDRNEAERWEIPCAWRSEIPVTEATLTLLKPDEMEVFCVGTFDAMNEIRGRSTLFGRAAAFLQAFERGFDLPGYSRPHVYMAMEAHA